MACPAVPPYQMKTHHFLQGHLFRLRLQDLTLYVSPILLVYRDPLYGKRQIDCLEHGKDILRVIGV